MSSHGDPPPSWSASTRRERRRSADAATTALRGIGGAAAVRVEPPERGRVRYALLGVVGRYRRRGGGDVAGAGAPFGECFPKGVGPLDKGFRVGGVGAEARQGKNLVAGHAREVGDGGSRRGEEPRPYEGARRRRGVVGAQESQMPAMEGDDVDAACRVLGDDAAALVGAEDLGRAAARLHEVAVEEQVAPLHVPRLLGRLDALQQRERVAEVARRRRSGRPRAHHVCAGLFALHIFPPIVRAHEARASQIACITRSNSSSRDALASARTRSKVDSRPSASIASPSRSDS